jgi:RNA polymerase sigma factor (TIGR02999 family)
MARAGSSPAAPVTHLLVAWGQGDRHALEQLVNEAYLRLVDINRVPWQDRAHFFAMAARRMRRILIDAARKHGNQKRGGDAPKVSLAEGLVVPDRPEELVALDEVLVALTQIDARRGRVVELKFFGGLTVEEIAEVLHVSPDTVKRDWKLAKAWLGRELRKTGTDQRIKSRD